MEPHTPLSARDAIIDFDVLVLDSYEIREATPEEIASTNNDHTEIVGKVIHARLSDGIGRMTGNDGVNQVVNPVKFLEVGGIFPGMKDDNVPPLQRMFERWKATRMPLRFLDFGRLRLLLEDQENLVTFGPGTRHIVAEKVNSL